MVLSPVNGGVNRAAEAQDNGPGFPTPLPQPGPTHTPTLHQTVGAGQVGRPNPTPSTTIPSLDPNDGPNPMRDRMQENAAKSRNNERHKRLVDDTAKLLELSNELKSDVDKSTKDELSVQVIQKAAQIEKLAHDVQARMKG
jgi:hypothetical protein